MGSASEHQAVVAFNDLVALGVVVAAASAGVDVPGDVSIVGSDDIQPASMSWPPLTSVGSPIDTIGRVAVQSLLRSHLPGRHPVPRADRARDRPGRPRSPRPLEPGGHTPVLAACRPAGAGQTVRTGTRRIVELAGLLAVDARLLCLDEPTAGIAQRESEAMGPLLVEVRKQLGASMLIIEHDMPLIMGMSDRVYCLELGKVIAQGDPVAVRNDPAVIASYLGTDERTIVRSGTAPS